jgi:hypothetical protein
VDGILGHNLLLSQAFRWESLRGWDFRPQLIVVSRLLGGNPFVDGILGHNLLLSRAFSVGIPSWMGFRLSRSLFSQPVTLFTMEFWLSESPSHELFFFFFHDGILAIKKHFSRTFFFFHDGILAIRKPFS